jgi:hypothetical protein
MRRCRRRSTGTRAAPASASGEGMKSQFCTRVSGPTRTSPSSGPSAQEGELHVDHGLTSSQITLPVVLIAHGRAGSRRRRARPQAAVVEVHRAVGRAPGSASPTETAEFVVQRRICSNRRRTSSHRPRLQSTCAMSVLSSARCARPATVAIHPAGHRAGAVDALAGGGADHLLAELAQQHALARDRSGCAAATPTMLRRPDLGLEAEQQVRRRQVEEVQCVRLQDLAVVHQPAHLLRGRRHRWRRPPDRAPWLAAR